MAYLFTFLSFPWLQHLSQRLVSPHVVRRGSCYALFWAGKSPTWLFHDFNTSLSSTFLSLLLEYKKTHRKKVVLILRCKLLNIHWLLSFFQKAQRDKKEPETLQVLVAQPETTAGFCIHVWKLNIFASPASRKNILFTWTFHRPFWIWQGGRLLEAVKAKHFIGNSWSYQAKELPRVAGVRKRTTGAQKQTSKSNPNRREQWLSLNKESWTSLAFSVLLLPHTSIISPHDSEKKYISWTI
jgi:hypothetical protein